MVRNSLFATVNTKPCPYNCIYCFTKCDNFRKNISIDSLSNRQLYEMTKDVDIIQPACDTEFLLHPQWKDLLLIYRVIIFCRFFFFKALSLLLFH